MKRKQILLALAMGLILVTASACSNTDKKDTSTKTQSTPVASSTPAASSSPDTTSKVDKPSKEEVPKSVIIKSGGKPGKATPKPVKVFESEKEELKTVKDTAFKAYDNKVLSGTEVRKALKDFKGKKVALLVATQMVMDGTTAYNKPDGNIIVDTPTVGASGLKSVLNSAGDNMTDKLTFINYGALLKGTKGKTMILFDKDCFKSKDGLDKAGDKYVTNTMLENTTKAGAAENIAEYLHMKSYLIKDTKGKVLGIAFYAVK